MRAEGRAEDEAVARHMALGSLSPAAWASDNQAEKSWKGEEGSEDWSSGCEE